MNHILSNLILLASIFGWIAVWTGTLVFIADRTDHGSSD